MIFVTLDDTTDLCLRAHDVVGMCKSVDDPTGTIIFTTRGNFQTPLAPAEVRARVETALRTAIN